MKKSFQILFVAVLLSTAAEAQPTPSTDTLPCVTRQRNYFYNSWYDTVSWFLNPNEPFVGAYNYETRLWSQFTSGDTRMEAWRQYSPEPMRIKGIWVMVNCTTERCVGDLLSRHAYLNPYRAPEYLYLMVRDPKYADWDLFDPRNEHAYAFDTLYYLKTIDSVRWDTLTPRMLCLPLDCNDSLHAYCHLFEVMFDSTITLQGEFFISGSRNSNVSPHGSTNTLYYPTYYYQIWHGGYKDKYNYSMVQVRQNGPWYPHIDPDYYGPAGPIVDGLRLLQVVPADTAQGTAHHTAYYPDSSYQTISANPKTGFHFSHWNDGNSDNPRTVFLTSDTSFTAFFSPWPAHEVRIVSEHPNVITRGEGLYNEGDSAEIFIQYLGADSNFSHWNDSLRDNPHSFVVTQDTTFVAHFKPRRAPTSVSSPDAPAPFTLSPNPAHTSVTVTLANPCGPGCSLSLIDASGHTVLSLPLPAGSSNATLPLRDLPAGPYFVSLSTSQGSSSQKLILQ